MNCPECGKQLTKGIVQARDGRSLFNILTMVTWWSDEEYAKRIRKHEVNLQLTATGHYCEECQKVFAAFEEKSCF